MAPPGPAPPPEPVAPPPAGAPPLLLAPPEPVAPPLATLPPGARSVFVLHDVEGLKHEEIAEKVGIVAGTSKAQLHRARRLLREALGR